MTQTNCSPSKQTVNHENYSVDIANFFKSAQDLTEDEFNQVMETLISKEARSRFSQQRSYGRRTFLQEGVDNNPDGLSDLQTERRRLGLPIVERNLLGKNHLSSDKTPLVPWSDIPDVLKTSGKGPITQEERDEAIKLLKKLNSSLEDF